MREKLNIDKKELEDYYEEHSTNQTAKYFNTSVYKLKILLAEYGIQIHTNSESVKLYTKNNGNAFQKKKEVEFQNYLNSINREEFVDYYNNHANQETKRYFNITCNFKRLLKELNVKVHSSHETKVINYTKLFGSYQNGLEIENSKRAKFYSKMKECILSKRYKTNLERYGSISPFGNKGIQDKAKQSFIDKYGVDNPFKVKDLVKNAVLDRYGVPSTACLPEVRAKQVKNGKNHLAKDGKRFDSSWEVIVYNYCLDNNLSIQTQIPIEYIYNDEKHITFIDFKINDRLYEVKGNHLLEGVFDSKNPIPSNAKLDLYKEYNVSIITDIKQIKDWDRYKNLTLIDICNFSGSIQ